MKETKSSTRTGTESIEKKEGGAAQCREFVTQRLSSLRRLSSSSEAAVTGGAGRTFGSMERVRSGCDFGGSVAEMSPGMGPGGPAGGMMSFFMRVGRQGRSGGVRLLFLNRRGWRRCGECVTHRWQLQHEARQVFQMSTFRCLRVRHTLRSRCRMDCCISLSP